MAVATKDIQPLKGKLEASVLVPGSKSLTNRALLLAALARGESHLSGLLLSDDSLVMVKALEALGFQLRFNSDSRACVVTGCSGAVPKASAEVWCGSAGTAARFLLAVVAAGNGVYIVDASAQLRARPMRPLVRSLEEQGVTVRTPETGSFPMTVTTKGLRGGASNVSDGGQSSQFLSAMLMASPLAKATTEISTKLLVSRPYIDMTVGLMERFGAQVERRGYDWFRVQAPRQYHATDYVVEPDASTASYFFASAAVTGGRVTVPHFTRRGLQGDSRFLDVLEQMGCTVQENAEGVTVIGPKKLRALTVNMGDISDTAMTLACIAPYADGVTEIQGIGNIRLKESDRITAVASGLKAMGVQVEDGRDYIRVYPSTPRGASIETFDDHRIAMAFSVMGLVTPGVVIQNPACVSKTCPEFFDLFESMSSQLGRA
ncbi:MAG: 3-phosphoshikimate 1-carboxyvinyltransferase [Dehalococcoidia bacterium]|nr:3-phosphoshikimate 1-carboxyvinyltransferase [Dehalococcoidia bacterium]